jgi:hypothetical protein
MGEGRSGLAVGGPLGKEPDDLVISMYHRITAVSIPIAILKTMVRAAGNVDDRGGERSEMRAG